MTSGAHLGTRDSSLFYNTPRERQCAAKGESGIRLSCVGIPKAEYTPHGGNSAGHLEWFPCQDGQGWMVILSSWGVLSMWIQTEFWPASPGDRLAVAVGPSPLGMISTCNLECLSPPVSGFLARIK